MIITWTRTDRGMVMLVKHRLRQYIHLRKFADRQEGHRSMQRGSGLKMSCEAVPSVLTVAP